MAVEVGLMEGVLKGVCPLEQLPPLTKKVVRVFVSSTFSDMKEERNALMTHVYPKLAEFCRDKHGLEFQVVDMRWGVPEHASDNHTTTDLCLQEIRKCQDVSVGPSFVSILGNKYGYRPIPRVIAQNVFQILSEASKAVDDGDNWSVIEEWYLLDENSAPAVYVLQPISSKLEHYNDMENPDLRKQAIDLWTQVNSQMTAALRKAATKAFEGGHIIKEDMHHFFQSVTEGEISEGVLKTRTIPKDSCVCILRNVSDIQENLTDEQAGRFVDVLEGKLDKEAQELLVELRDIRMRDKLPDTNISHVDVLWKHCGANVTLDQIVTEDLKVAKFAQKFLKRDLAVHKHKEYLDKICDEVYVKVTELVHESGARNEDVYDELTTEVLQHAHFAKTRCDIFEGRDETLETVKEYLSSDSNKPMCIYGNSGCGKTSVLAKVIEVLQMKYPVNIVSKEEEILKEAKDSYDVTKKSKKAKGSDDVTIKSTEAESIQTTSDKLTSPEITEVEKTKESSNLSGTHSLNVENKANNCESELSETGSENKETSKDNKQQEMVNNTTTDDVVTDNSNVNNNAIPPEEKEQQKTADASEETKAEQVQEDQANINPSQEQATNNLSKDKLDKNADQNEATETTEISDELDFSPYVLLRFLGTTPYTSNVYQMLISVCKQLCKLYDREFEEPEKFSDLVKHFHSLLQCAKPDKQLYIFLDSIDQLMPAYNAYKLKWLPSTLPPNVKMVLSTIDEGYTILEAMKEKYYNKGGSFIQICPLGENVGMQVIKKWLTMTKRTMTEPQEALVKQALEACSLPLYARIAFDHIRRWKSFDDITQIKLEHTVKGAIHKLYDEMEFKFGPPLVKHSLAYLTASRYGLSEVELEHILSLDDALLNKVYKWWRPPVRRIPPLLWTRLRSEIESYIVERSADDILVLFWYHRQFISTTKEKYLADPEFSREIHSNLADFFLGKWGGGKPKPFEYTDAQVSRFKLDDAKSSSDRKVPLQPYLFKSRGTDSTELRFNKRKLSELPFHLLKCKKYKQLKLDVFINFEWLFAKLKSTGAQSVLEEYQIFMGADRKLRRDPDMQAMLVTLQLIRPYIHRYPDTLSLELSGRLANQIGKSDSITSLIKQCDAIGTKYCPIVPLVTSYETANRSLQQNINVRISEPWHNVGALTLTRDFKTMYIIDYNDIGSPVLSSWDVENGEKIHEYIIRERKEGNLMDIYFQLLLDKTETLLIAFYQQKYYEGFNKERVKGDGSIDLISVANGEVLHSLSAPLHDHKYFNPFLYLIENWLGVRIGHKSALINLRDADMSQAGSNQMKRYGRPYCVTPDELKSVSIQNQKVRVKVYAGCEPGLAGTRTNIAVLRDFNTREDLGEFDNSDSANAIAITSDCNTVLLAAGIPGEIYVYDIRRAKAGKLYKVQRTLALPRNEKIKVFDVEEFMKRKTMGDFAYYDEDEKEKSYEKAEPEYSLRLWVSLFISPNNKYVMACYQGENEWEAFLWAFSPPSDKLSSVFTSKFICRITDPKPLNYRFPVFNFDGSYLLFLIHNRRKVAIMSTKEGKIINRLSLGSNVRDIIVSQANNQFAALLGKDVVFMNIGEDGEDDNSVRPNKTKNNPKQNIQYSIIPKEIVRNDKMLKEIVLDHGMIPSELRSPSEVADTDSLSSARSRRKFALDKWYSPDGSKVAHMHSRLQVVDTVQEEIKYTPHTGEKISRTTYIADTKQAVTETFEIPHEIQDGDKIVNAEKKIKYRVPSSPEKNRYQVISIPSIITIYGVTNGKLRKIHRLTVYQEMMMTISDVYLVTLCKKKAGDFLNVYDIETGRLTATTDVPDSFSCARLSRDNSKLFIMNQHFNLWEMSMQTKTKTTVMAGYPAKKFIIRDILTFPQDDMVLVIRYAREHQFNTNRYLHVDLVENKLTYNFTPIFIKSIMEDISKDGTLAVDPQLCLYHIPTGEKLCEIPYANSGPNMQIQARITDDKQYVAFVDKQDDTLHLVKIENNGQSCQPIATCFTHIPDLHLTSGFELRLGGRLLVIKGHRRLVVLAIAKRTDILQRQKQVQPLFKLKANKNVKEVLQKQQVTEDMYKSEINRAVALSMTSEAKNIDDVVASLMRQVDPNNLLDVHRGRRGARGSRQNSAQAREDEEGVEADGAPRREFEKVTLDLRYGLQVLRANIHYVLVVNDLTKKDICIYHRMRDKGKAKYQHHSGIHGNFEPIEKFFPTSWQTYQDEIEKMRLMALEYLSEKPWTN